MGLGDASEVGIYAPEIIVLVTISCCIPERQSYLSVHRGSMI